MGSSLLAALLAGLVVAFVEGMGRFYPSREQWWRWRRIRGRELTRKMRERVEAMADNRTPRNLALAVFALAIGWVASASLLDKRWYEVVADVIPSLFVAAGLLRIPHSLRAIAARMKSFERQAGDDPDTGLGGDGGAAAVVL